MDDIEIVNLVDPRLLKRYKYHNRRLTQLLFLQDDKGLISGSLDGNCIRTKFNNDGNMLGFKPHDGPILGVSYSPKADLAATCSTDNTASIWRPDETKQQIHNLIHRNTVRGLDINVNSSKLVTIADDNSIKIWDLETRNYCYMMSLCKEAWMRAVKYSPDGELFATAGQDRIIRIFDNRVRFPIKVFRDFSGVPRKIDWSPDSNLLGAAFNDNRIQIYNLAQNEIHDVYDMHAAPVNDIAFHPHGRFLASASDDHSIKIIDILLGVPLYTLLAHKSPVRCVEFNGNGSQIISGDDDGKMYLWRTNLSTYSMERFVEISSKRETMAAAGENHSDISMLVNQLNVKVPHIDGSKIKFNENINKICNVHYHSTPVSRIPISVIQRRNRYEVDDY